MIAKVLGTVAIAALAGFGAAAPASADPGSFGEITCSCQPQIQQFFPSLDDPVEKGIRQGFADTSPGVPDGIPHG